MVTPVDIRVRFPEFGNTTDYPDARIQLFIDDAEATINSKCPNYDLMVAYLTAHLLLLSTRTDAGDTTTNKSVASESVGDVSVSYASNSDGVESFYSTAYGQRYLDLRKNCIGRPLIG